MHCHEALLSALCNWCVLLTSQRLYRSVYEKNKMKIHIVPDMVEMITAKDTQKKVSEVDYRLHLHEWICHPDLQVNSHVRKVTDQISDVSPLLTKVPPPPPHAHPKEKQTHLFLHLILLPALLSYIPPGQTGIQSCFWKKVSVHQCFHGSLGLIA